MITIFYFQEFTLDDSNVEISMTSQIFQIDKETFSYHLKQIELIFDLYPLRSQYEERGQLYDLWNKTRGVLFESFFRID